MQKVFIAYNNNDNILIHRVRETLQLDMTKCHFVICMSVGLSQSQRNLVIIFTDLPILY